LFFVSCSFNSNINTVTPYSPRQIADYIISEQPDMSVLNALSPDDDYFNNYISYIYNLNAAGIKDGMIYYADKTYANEIAVFLITDNNTNTAEETKNALSKYIARRADTFEGYAPEQAAILRNSIAVVRGNYVALLICENPQNAKSDFLACFSENPLKLPDSIPAAAITTEIMTEAATDTTEITEETTAESMTETANKKPDLSNDAYDHDAVVTAWKSGDTSTLSQKNFLIYEACADVINKVIRKDMNDFEKELAIHDWIINWTSYDTDVISNAPDAKPDPDNNNPYGLLLNQKAICMGYSVTFKLFMDLLDIECIIVEGKSGTSELEDHAWNMVRIDGEWYCVDVTWDDPLHADEKNFSAHHKYFNVTSQYMRDTNHHWDESTTPEATTFWNFDL